MIGCGCNGKGGSCVSGGGNGLLGQSCNCHQCAWQVVIGVGMAVVHFWKVGRFSLESIWMGCKQAMWQGAMVMDLWQQSGSNGCVPGGVSTAVIALSPKLSQQLRHLNSGTLSIPFHKFGGRAIVSSVLGLSDDGSDAAAFTDPTVGGGA